MIERFPQSENIELSLPLNAAYVSAARLTASSIANRLGYNADEIEDIKAAVSEACIFFIKQMPLEKGKFKISFQISEDTIEFTVSCGTDSQMDEPKDELSLLMIRSLMDRMEIRRNAREHTYELSMAKTHKDRFIID